MDIALPSRIVGIIFTASNFLLLLLVLGLLLQSTRRYRRLGQGLIVTITAILLLVFFFPVDDWLAAPLENRFPRPSWPAHVDGVIVLGGGENGAVFATRGLAASIPAEDRLVAAAELARLYPHAKMIFSGGIAPMEKSTTSEASVARAEFQQIGVPASRVILEGRSRNTWENLLYSWKIARPRPDETWLVVTSAMQMPRAMGVAARLRWRVLPWPVDYVTTGKADGVNWNSSLAARLTTLEFAVHEWGGIGAYQIFGRLG